MPSFNGVNIFGLRPRMATQDPERETQHNSFFGINGTESLDGGFRHTRTIVNGVHVGSDSDELAAIHAIFRSYKDGLAYVLVDNFGAVWYNVKLMGFSPQMPVTQDAYGNFIQNYTAEFMHLSQ